jgi:hypothetical protein
VPAASLYKAQRTPDADQQIVLLVTKAVGDSFGAHGIADTMIKFNGFPFLEKEDKESGDPSFIEPSELRSRFACCGCSSLRVSRQRDGALCDHDARGWDAVAGYW